MACLHIPKYWLENSIFMKLDVLVHSRIQQCQCNKKGRENMGYFTKSIHIVKVTSSFIILYQANKYYFSSSLEERGFHVESSLPLHEILLVLVIT